MNKKILFSLMTIAISLTGCGKTNNSDSSSNETSSSVETSIDSSNEVISSIESSSTEELQESSEVSHNYQTIDDVNKLFATYETDEDYDYMAIYECQTIADREYQGGWVNTYMYDGINILLTYEENGIHYTDYYIYDEETQEMIYYLDTGRGIYKYLDQENEYYFNYVAYIDYFELAGVDWENDMVFDLENNVCIPKDNLAKDNVGKTIFGSNPNEYWHKIEVYWEDGYISKVIAISIYQEINYYYTVTLSDHGYASGSVIVPENVEEFTNPYQPYYKNKEVYTGQALSEAQANALTMFTDEKSMNYTVDVRWTAVYDGDIVENSYLDFKLLAQDGNYEYSYAESQAPSLTHYFYLLSNNSNYPVCFLDEDFDGTYTISSYGMDDYEGYVSQIYLDRVLLYGINPDDFIYDEEKGYITAKNEETTNKYCEDLFFYKDTYGGLRIYLKDDGNGTLTIDKIVTSVFIVQSNGSYYSFVKTYTFTDINSTTITYPDGVSL